MLAVDQESTLNFTLTPASVSESVVVTSTAPLLDTENATMGTEISKQYIQRNAFDGPRLLRADFSGGGRHRGGRVGHVG